MIICNDNDSTSIEVIQLSDDQMLCSFEFYSSLHEFNHNLYTILMFRSNLIKTLMIRLLMPKYYFDINIYQAVDKVSDF